MTMMSRRSVTFGLLAAACPMRGAMSGHASARRGAAFGAIVSVTAKGRSAGQVEAALDASFAAIRAVERSMSLFDPKSELSRFNSAGVLKNPSPLVLDVLEQSLRAWRLTAGAFDPSVQPLWDIWSAAGPVGPSPALLVSARARIGFGTMAWNGLQVSTARRGQQLTLNGIAQGYAADLVAEIMRRHLIESAHIDTGEIGAAGNVAIHENLIGVQDPRDMAKIAGYIPAGTRFLATSGDYAAAFSPDFSAHHIFDPRTGFSPKELSSVTVLAPTGALADALATAFMVTGQDGALKRASVIEGVDALLISKSGDHAMTPGMRKIFRPA